MKRRVSDTTQHNRPPPIATQPEVSLEGFCPMPTKWHPMPLSRPTKAPLQLP